MAVSKSQKIEILNNLVEKIKEAKSVGFATTNGLTVEEFANLRKDLREVNATYTLAKKTLMKKAVKKALDLDIDLEQLPGQIGIVCSFDDAIAGLGKVNKMVKDTKGEKIDWALSIFEGEIKDLEETKQIAGMPSRETLLGRLVGSLQSPISSIARFFDAAAKDLEEKSKEKVGDLKGNSESNETKEESPKSEAKKEETKAEEVKKDENSKTEAKKEETKTEAKVEKNEEKKDEKKEAKVEEKKEETK